MEFLHAQVKLKGRAQKPWPSQGWTLFRQSMKKIAWKPRMSTAKSWAGEMS